MVDAYEANAGFPLAFAYTFLVPNKSATAVVVLRHGDDVIIAGSVSDEDARKTYPQGWKAPRPYIRIVPAPRM